MDLYIPREILTKIPGMIEKGSLFVILALVLVINIALSCVNSLLHELEKLPCRRIMRTLNF